MKLLSTIVLGLALSMSFAAEASHTKRIRCESFSHRYNECEVGGEIINVQLEEQLSNSPCRLNRTWGADWRGDDYIWVDDGCRGIFRVRIED